MCILMKTRFKVLMAKNLQNYLDRNNLELVYKKHRLK